MPSGLDGVRHRKKGGESEKMFLLSGAPCFWLLPSATPGKRTDTHEHITHHTSLASRFEIPRYIEQPLSAGGAQVDLASQAPTAGSGPAGAKLVLLATLAGMTCKITHTHTPTNALRTLCMHVLNFRLYTEFGV